jgi:hypothetical protein
MKAKSRSSQQQGFLTSVTDALVGGKKSFTSGRPAKGTSLAPDKENMYISIFSLPGNCGEVSHLKWKL